MKIGLFYGSTTCYTEMAAEQMITHLPFDVTLHNVKDTALSEMIHYDVLILGISTWDFGEIQEDWQSQWQDIERIDLTGKIVALFGLGDQCGYGEWYLDAMGELHQKVLEQGGLVVGEWSTEGYDFIASKAVTDDGKHFVGLALDEDSQYDLSADRIATWCHQLTAILEG